MKPPEAADAGMAIRGAPVWAAEFLRRYLEILVGLIFLIVYTLTLSPGLLPADAGEYQVVGSVLGVAHPPGFALYTLLSWLIWIPQSPPSCSRVPPAFWMRRTLCNLTVLLWRS